MKKILLGLGTAAVATAPLAATISCGREGAKLEVETTYNIGTAPHILDSDGKILEVGINKRGTRLPMPEHLTPDVIAKALESIKSTNGIEKVTTIHFVYTVVNVGPGEKSYEKRVFSLNVPAGKASEFDALATSAAKTQGVAIEQDSMSTTSLPSSYYEGSANASEYWKKGQSMTQDIMSTKTEAELRAIFSDPTRDLSQITKEDLGIENVDGFDDSQIQIKLDATGLSTYTSGPFNIAEHIEITGKIVSNPDATLEIHPFLEPISSDAVIPTTKEVTDDSVYLGLLVKHVGDPIDVENISKTPGTTFEKEFISQEGQEFLDDHSGTVTAKVKTPIASSATDNTKGDIVVTLSVEAKTSTTTPAAKVEKDVKVTIDKPDALTVGWSDIQSIFAANLDSRLMASDMMSNWGIGITDPAGMPMLPEHPPLISAKEADNFLGITTPQLPYGLKVTYDLTQLDPKLDPMMGTPPTDGVPEPVGITFTRLDGSTFTGNANFVSATTPSGNTYRSRTVDIEYKVPVIDSPSEDTFGIFKMDVPTIPATLTDLDTQFMREYAHGVHRMVSSGMQNMDRMKRNKMFITEIEEATGRKTVMTMSMNSFNVSSLDFEADMTPLAADASHTTLNKILKSEFSSSSPSEFNLDVETTGTLPTGAAPISMEMLAPLLMELKNQEYTPGTPGAGITKIVYTITDSHGTTKTITISGITASDISELRGARGTTLAFEPTSITATLPKLYALLNDHSKTTLT